MNRADLADLSAFVAVADHLSFRAAASQLGVTPSALSHSMRQLEERLGVRLLNRTTRSVSVTDAGLRLLERLRPAVGQIAGALEDLRILLGGDLGQLRTRYELRGSCSDAALFSIPDEYKLIRETVQQSMAQGPGVQEGAEP